MAECNSRTAKKVLAHLIKHQKLCQEEDYNYINRIKKEVEMSSQAITDALNVLIEMGIISDVERQGRKKVIYVTPEVVEQAKISKEFQTRNTGDLGERIF